VRTRAARLRSPARMWRCSLRVVRQAGIAKRYHFAIVVSFQRFYVTAKCPMQASISALWDHALERKPREANRAMGDVVFDGFACRLPSIHS